MANISDVTAADFQAKVLDASKTKPIVVDFWAEWCGPCKAMAPILDEVAAHYGDKAEILKLNVDEHPSVSQQYGVMSIPTTIYFKDDKPAGQSIGLTDKTELMAHIDKLLA
ncbi:MAG: thioredoxin [Patescibacteria group bacterium]